MGGTGTSLKGDPTLMCGENLDEEKNAALLTWIQQLAPYGVITLEPDFRVRTWNNWMAVHSSLQAGDVVGKDLFSLFPELQERKLRPYFERGLQGEPNVLSATLHHYLIPLPSPFRAQGGRMLQTARIAPLYSGQEICGVVVVIEDVTQREVQALTLSSQHRRDEVLSSTLVHLLKTEEPRKAARPLFFQIARHLDFDMFLLYLRNSETGELSFQAGGAPTEAEKDFVECPFLKIMPAGFRESVILGSKQIDNDSAYAFLKKAGVSAAIVFPLFSEARELGLLSFTTTSRDTITAEETNLLTTIAQSLATALDRENAKRQLQAAKEALSGQAHLLEKTVQERTAELQTMVAELETFSYAVAHDLREPVRGLIGYSDVLMHDFGAEIPADAMKVVERLARTAKRMEALTRDLLAFSSVSQQKIQLSEVDTAQAVEGVVALRGPAVRQAITVQTPLQPVIGHRALLQQVLSNLIDNAIKFVTPNAPAKITIGTEMVTQAGSNTRSGPSLVFSSVDSLSRSARASEKPARRVRIWVSDQGVGIPASVHQKIFGIFERGQNSDQYEGTGMGLAIVARAMQRMGGACGVESEVGKGSRFWLELPAVEAA